MPWKNVKMVYFNKSPDFLLVKRSYAKHSEDRQGLWNWCCRKSEFCGSTIITY